MAARLPWILAALALVLGALGVFLWRSDAPRVEAPRSQARAAAAPRSDAHLVEVQPESSRAPAPAPGAKAGGKAFVDPLQGAAARAPMGKLIVRGRVSGVDPERVELVLAPMGRNVNPMLRGSCAADARYEIDASRFVGSTTLTLQLELTVTHPDCWTARRRIEVRRGVTPEVKGRTVLVPWSEGTTVCEVDVELERATVVHGVVLGFEDAEGTAVVAAEVHDGRPESDWVAEATPDDTGRFELKLQPHTSYAIVAAAPDLRPTTVRVDLGGPGAQALQLHADPGVELAGRLRPAPGFGADEFSVDLHFALEEGAEQPELWPRPAARFDKLVWIDGAFEWRLRSQRTRHGGTFLFRGLAPREYELRALGVGVQGEELRAWPVARLRAPAYGLTLGPALTSVDLDLGPLPDGPIAFALRDEERDAIPELGPYRTDAHGRAQVHLPPGRAYGVLVGGEVVGRIATPGAGEFARFALAR